MLQHSPNSDFQWFSVQHCSRGKIHFWPSQRCKAQGPLQQSPGQQEGPPDPLLSPGWQDTVLRVPGQSWPWGTWGTFWGGTSWHVLARPGSQQGHPGPSWTILGLRQLHLTWKILCSKEMGWVALWVPIPVISVKCQEMSFFSRNVIFGSFGNIPPGPTLGAKCHRLRVPVGFATRSSQKKSQTDISLFTHPLFVTS